MGESKYFLIRSMMNSKVVDIEGNNREAGTHCVMWDQKSSGENDNQLFFECPLTGVIRSKMAPDMCLDVDDDGDGDLVIMPVQPGDKEQAWDITSDMLTNRRLGKVIDIEAASNWDGAKVLAYEPHGGENQRFMFDFQNPTYFYIVSDYGTVLDISGADPAPGSRVITWTRHEEPKDNQLWYEGKDGKLHSKLNNYCIDAEDTDNLSMQPSEHGKCSQRFTMDSTTNAIINCDDRGVCFDIKGEESGEGGELCQWSWKDGANQKWKFEYV